jgi:6-phosphogluconolactonase (cycloisomerase 2 family)
MSRRWILGLLLSTILVFFFAGNLHAQNNFVYTNDDVLGPNTVSGFTVGGNGALTPVLGSPFLTGGMGAGGGLFAANRATICSAEKLIYVSNAASNDVSGFSVNVSTGSLTLVPGSPFRTGGSGSDGIALACTPNGQFLMAANSGSSNITVFRIGSNGALTPVGSPFPTGSVPDGIKVSPDGNFLAAALVNSNAMAMFSIALNGALAPVPGSPFPGATIGDLTGVDINCASDVLFGGNAAVTTTVNVFNIASDGALTPLPGSPFTPGVGRNSNVVLLSPNERFLFVSNQQSSSVTVFSVASNGSLSLVAGSPFAAPGSILPSGMTTDQAGNFLYIAGGNFPGGSGSNKVYGYSVANNGLLTPVPSSPFLTGRQLTVAHSISGQDL